MIKFWKFKSAVAVAIALSAAQANAQTPLELEYEEAQTLLNAALQEAVGSFDAMIILPQASFENPFRIGVNVSAIVDSENRLEIKGYDEGEGRDGNAFAISQADDAFLTRPENYISPYGARTQTFAAGAVEADNPLYWALHGDRLYLTPAPVRDADFREERGLSVKASGYLAQSDAFRNNANFSASKPGR